MKKLFSQIIKFGFVGGLCFLIEYGSLIFLKEICHANLYVSNTIAFTISVTVNYLLSMKFVFKADENKSKTKEFVLFIFLSIIGLLINQFVMWLGVDKAGIDYRIIKIAATAVVMVYNFITRKLLIEKKND